MSCEELEQRIKDLYCKSIILEMKVGMSPDLDTQKKRYGEYQENKSRVQRLAKKYNCECVKRELNMPR